MAELKIKFAQYNRLTYNFREEQLSDVQDAVRALKGTMPPAKSWDNTISLKDFEERCKQQPDEKTVYLPGNLTTDKIASILRAENPREIIKAYLASSDGRSAGSNMAELTQSQQKELHLAEEEEKKELKKEFENFKKDLEKEHNKVEEVNKKDLEKWVKDCDRVLLDFILAHYKNEEGVKASALSTKRKKVIELVLEQDDTKIASLIRFSSNNTTQSNSEITNTKKEFEVAKETYDDKKEAYSNAKQSLKGNREYIADMSEMLLVADDVKANEMLGREQTKRNLARAKRQRDNVKRRGLLEFSKGVAMATIEGKADAYIATALEVANKTKQATENVIKVNPNINPETLEQNDVVLQSIVPASKSLVKQYSNEGNKEVGTNAASNALLVKAEDSTNNKVRQPQGTGAR